MHPYGAFRYPPPCPTASPSRRARLLDCRGGDQRGHVALQVLLIEGAAADQGDVAVRVDQEGLWQAAHPERIGLVAGGVAELRIREVELLDELLRIVGQVLLVDAEHS